MYNRIRIIDTFRQEVLALREDIHRIFRELLQPFPKKGAKLWKLYEKENPGNSKDILLSIRTAETELDFVSAFSYYLFAKAEHEGDDEHRKVIDVLNNTIRDSRNSDRICWMLSYILLSEDPDANNGAVISDHIFKLHEEITLFQDAFISYLSVNEQSVASAPRNDAYCSFLYKVLCFVCQVCPTYFTQENTPLRDPIFCVAVLDNIRRGRNSIPAASYMYNGLSISDPGCFYVATSACYYFEMRKQNYQGAYDILYSWINKKMVGQYEKVSRTFTSADDGWRDSNPRYSQTWYTFLSSLCSAMADMQSTTSKQYAFFRNYSTELALHDTNSTIPTLTSRIFSINALNNNREYEKSQVLSQSILNHLIEEMCKDKASDQQLSENITAALLGAIISNAGILCNPSADKDRSTVHSADYYKDQLVQLVCEFVELGIHHEASPLSRYIFRIFENNKAQMYLSAEVIAALLCIFQLVREIQQELRYDQCLQTVYKTHDPEIDQAAENQRCCCKPIAYYTTMSNLKYLLEPVYADNHRCRPRPQSEFSGKPEQLKGKNCLTMMHAHYMNDPREGITLLDSLSDAIDKNSDSKNLLFPKSFPATFREQIFDNQFVFLKSFTDLIDQLNMWSMYGSDRGENTDSNGCCISIAPESFEMMLNISHLTKILRDPDDNHDTDDLRLYKVAYVENGQLCGSASALLVHYYAQLKKQVLLLNHVLVKTKNETERKHLMALIVSVLQEVLTPIIFLFKDASYQAEKELRLIVTRSRTREDMERIRQTPQNPPKLYVNPYHQVYIDQIILGPKVSQPDSWIPYLQFELTKMWESWPEEKYGKRVPSVRKSSINYRD